MAQEAVSGQGWCPEVGEAPEAILGHPRRSGAKVSPQVHKPAPLAIPARPWQEEGKIDDLDRHLGARARLHRLVAALCRKYRMEFPAYRYKAATADSHREVANLLRDYGGLPETGGNLNGVPADVLEKAVEAFAAYFGLGVGDDRPSGATAPVAAHLDPAPRKRVDAGVPW